MIVPMRRKALFTDISFIHIAIIDLLKANLRLFLLLSPKVLLQSTAAACIHPVWHFTIVNRFFYLRSFHDFNLKRESETHDSIIASGLLGAAC